MPSRVAGISYITLIALCVLAGAVSATEIRVAPECSIQEAVDATPDGATIRLDPVEYEGAITLRRPITLIGSNDPENPTVFRSTTLFPTVTVENAAQAELIDVVIEGSSRLRSDGIAVYGSADASLLRVEIRGNRGHGVSVYSTGTTQIVGCRIHSNDGFAVVVQTSSATVLGRDNDLRGNGAELGLYAPSRLRTPLVAQTDRTLVCVPADYGTVQEAIDAVAPGGIVELMEGEFSEPLVLWKPVTLRGQGVEATRLGAPAEAAYGGSVISDAAGIVMERMTLCRPWSLCGPEMVLQEIRVSCADSVGLELRGTTGARLTSVEISDVRGHGVFMGNRAEAELRDCRIVSCQVGLHTEDHAFATVETCTFSACSMRGIEVDTSATLVARNSLCEENSYGLLSAGISTLEACTFERNGSFALRIGDGTSSIADCVIRGSSGVGLYVARGEAYAEDCLIAENGGECAVECAERSSLEMVACTVSGNQGIGVGALFDGRATLIDCRIAENGYGGIYSPAVLIADSAAIALESCSIVQNFACGVATIGPSDAANAEWQGAAPPPTDSELRMVDCTVFGNASDGLQIGDVRSVHIEKTLFERNLGRGVLIQRDCAGAVELVECDITGQTEGGIWAVGPCSLVLDRCAVSNCGSVGLFLGGSVNASIAHCTLSRNVYGVLVTESPHIVLAQCEIARNSGYGLMIYGLECASGRFQHYAELDFTGQLSGSGNIIPDQDGPNGNGLGGICPDGWEFLLEGSTAGDES